MSYNLKLDQRRIEAGLTCGELARRAGIGPTAYSQIVNGKRRPYLRTVHLLAAALNTTPEEIGFSGREVVK